MSLNSFPSAQISTKENSHSQYQDKKFPMLNIITQKEIGVFRSLRLIDGKGGKSLKYAE